MRVAVLGAGPSGLAQLRAFEAARVAGVENLPEVVCFEKQSDLGGMWNYTWRTGLDEFGEPVHASMYRYLWSNGPKECLEFADYSFEEHFGKPIPSYPPRAVLRDYIMGRVEASDARRHIRFNHAVKWVEYSEETEKFSVTVKDLVADELVTEEFDHVVSATGHFSTPHAPEFEGLDTFAGRVMHAHDFREAREFTGRTVLLIGSSYSAEDIASQCHKYGAERVILSYRSRPTGYAWPEGIDEVPLLQRLEGSTAHFADGTSAEVDGIILCTGYLHHFSYLPDDLRLVTNNRLYPGDLYKGVVWQENPKFLYLGMQDQYFTFNMFDAQAWFAREVILGHVDLPPVAERQADIAEWRAREEAGTCADDEIDFQAAYIRDLLSYSDYPEFGVEQQADLLKQWKQDKKRDIMGYRNLGYRSTLTGSMAPPLHDDWINVLDDSAESFLLHNGVTDHPRARAALDAREAIVTTPITTRQDEPVRR
ncbi:NAD(P)/FAD-dependent oxidoreductase [Nocardioides jishulii]|uniref:Trimethylamine monooxygenase n=2 Tax=Nocardioides jishulii TaxID=2575440 RepID=A0A4U2YNS2_9ACTN|nr:NAD(P)/FAD-dependent oxidoreductase [Nocardioides jishulii]QCX27833.1 NAD(P)/FAD-dependent oxidoreductase [Nocardioides jishulii]TKI62640.1 NAD(P)/FAD-dependent oxidoreductase [Nocardioides jishulii]